jgi:hypothetical protein
MKAISPKMQGVVKGHSFYPTANTLEENSKTTNLMEKAFLES